MRVHDPTDPVLGALAPETAALHWHGDLFELPDGARPLASSEQTEHQAFRHGNAWGVLFHPEGEFYVEETSNNGAGGAPLVPRSPIGIHKSG